MRVFESSELEWSVLHCPRMKQGERLQKSIRSEVGDRLPMGSSTMRFADVAQYILDIVEHKVDVPTRRQVAIGYVS